ncbi:TPA: ATP-NAD kinase [Raoultella ornithinolytica]|uniref:ATP-NAD kinase n=1 Tax=Raoultella ornithinolytica TaxID=54291 RepID=UPI0021A595F1|nr:ATP-NAD kinase [Raoultella ornithinolytica]MCT1678521.1 ATP-NAD kinase [Raoultella ornithinolytica]HCT5193981.1 ATP-NAD kinase [Raoultella ornithinolytica]HDG9785096.1 ATP-NAD kinase [Raoultella ornithinolytica]HDG9797745.1 ATP-NAD kinase [Raoultella ornithinolytica]HDG9800611.1 ATP-NAD kinase [Raoultella ornithinolytica]
MSGLINPKDSPEESAYALIIELVRAQRVPVYSSGNISSLLSMYDDAVKHFKEEGTENN